MRFLGSAFNVAVQNPSSSIEYSPIEVERFKRMSISPHSSNLAKVNKISSPAAVSEKMTVQTAKRSKARRSITYADEFLCKKLEMKSVTSCRWRIEEVKKPK